MYKRPAHSLNYLFYFHLFSKTVIQNNQSITLTITMNPILILSLLPIALAADRDAELNALVADLAGHSSEYLQQVASGNIPPADLLALAQQVKTFTDDSYTTLYPEVDMGEVSAYVTGLPWYSSRLASIFGADAAPATSTEEAPVETSSAEETSVEETSVEETSAEETSAEETTVVESTVSTEETSSEVPAVETANNAVGISALGPLAAVVMLVPALL